MLFLRVRGTLKICTHKNPHSRGDALTASRGTTSSSYFGSNKKKKLFLFHSRTLLKVSDDARKSDLNVSDLQGLCQRVATHSYKIWHGAST